MGELAKIAAESAESTPPRAIRFITRKWPPAVGGMETYSAKIAEGLRTSGSVEIIALPGRRSGREPTRFALIVFGITTALRLLLSREARAVHVADLASWPLAWIASVRHPSSRIVISAHGSDISYCERRTWRGGLYRAYLRLGAAKLKRAHIIANSNYIAGLARSAGFGQVSVVPLATDLRANGSAERRHLLYAGRISRAKGLRFIVEKVLPLLPAEVRLRVAGSLWEKSERPMLYAPRVDYLGVLSPNELAKELGRAAAVVIPTRECEGFGLVAIEAAACGAWVIASKHSGLTDVVKPPIGVAVDANDPEEWAIAIRSVLSQGDDARQAAADAARREVNRSYRWARVIEQTLAIYGVGISSGGRRRED
jgi:glycosyltransferase involved in cell wall biosynthesis